MEKQVNVLGQPLAPCCEQGGYTRQGYCFVPADDFGNHSVCARVTDAFLQFSKAQGNDLITPIPQYQFPGLRDGDAWCLCAIRWLHAQEAGVSPPLYLASTQVNALKRIDFELLVEHALDADQFKTEIDTIRAIIRQGSK